MKQQNVTKHYTVKNKHRHIWDTDYNILHFEWTLKYMSNSAITGSTNGSLSHSTHITILISILVLALFY